MNQNLTHTEKLKQCDGMFIVTEKLFKQHFAVWNAPDFSSRKSISLIKTLNNKSFISSSGNFVCSHKNGSKIKFLKFLFTVVEQPTSACSVQENLCRVNYALLAITIVQIIVLGTFGAFVWKKMQRSVKLLPRLCFIVSTMHSGIILRCRDTKSVQL